MINILSDLKENPKVGKVDHISLLNKVYEEYSAGNKELEPLAMFYLNDFDDLPSLKQKHLWNEDSYSKVMQRFIDYH